MKISHQIILALALTVIASGCVSITSKYPPIEYYKLHQEPVSAKNLGKIDITLMVRNFSVSSDLESENLQAIWDDNHIQKYYYHRWATDFPSMITDYFVERFSNVGAFTTGVVKSSSWILPDYYLEANILELTAKNSEKTAEGSNYVYVSLQITLARRTPLKTGKDVVFNENYYQKIERADNTVKSIVPAYSKALSQIADKVILDIEKAVAFDRTKEGG